MKVNQLAEQVKAIADAQGRGRQYLATFFARLAGTHAAGFVLHRQESAGKWGPATYALNQATQTDVAPLPMNPMSPMPGAGATTSGNDHLDGAAPLMTPMSPMPDALAGDAIPPGAETEI